MQEHLRLRNIGKVQPAVSTDAQLRIIPLNAFQALHFPQLCSRCLTQWCLIRWRLFWILVDCQREFHTPSRSSSSIGIAVTLRNFVELGLI
jgi:hypothetical protein